MMKHHEEAERKGEITRDYNERERQNQGEILYCTRILFLLYNHNDG